MFCSKCGKTLPYDVENCPSCGTRVGNSRFAGRDITSAQSIIIPGQDEYEPIPVNNYTRTTYTSMSDKQLESGEVDSRTSYRPVYDGSVPDDIRGEMMSDLKESRNRVLERDEEARRAVDEARSEEKKPVDEVKAPVAEEPEEEKEAPVRPVQPVSEETLRKIRQLDAELQEEDDELDMSQFKARPIETRGRAGISRDVSEYIRQIEDTRSRKSRRKAAESEDISEDIEDIPDIDDIEAEVPADEEIDPGEAADDIETEPANKPAKKRIVKARVPEDEDIPEDTYYDDPEDEYLDNDRPRVFVTVLKIVAAIALVAALAFGIVRYLGYIRSNQSSAPIEGVTEALYNSAIELLDSHNTTEYRNVLMNDYNTNGILSVSTKLDSDSSAIAALLPAEPAANDATFLQAVEKIQENIGSAILMDVLASENGDNDDSAYRWSIVNNSIAQLKGATSAAELTAIINGETITVRNETPAPTAEPIVYTPLQKGDENNDVLQLQIRLFNLGYLEGDRDGAFGSKTQTAIKRFQETIGVEATGVADSNTQAALYADDAPYAPGATTPTPAPAATEAPVPAEAPVAEEVPATEAEAA